MNAIYHTCSWLTRSLFTVMYRTTWHGLGNIPMKGQVIVASNHVSFFDPPLVGCSAPRDFHYLARETLMDNPFSAWLLPRLNVIGVDREGGKDTQAVRHVLKSLKEGKAMVIFPEGTRSADGQLQQAKAGIGLLACRSRAQVLPVRVFGAHSVYSRKHKIPSARGRIKIVYGKCLQPDEFDPGKGTDERYQVAINRIMGAIADLEKPNDFAD